MLPFSDFEEKYLFPLKKLFMAEDVQFRYQVVSTLSSLLGNLSFFEWPRLEQRRRVDDETTDSCRWAMDWYMCMYCNLLSLPHLSWGKWSGGGLSINRGEESIEDSYRSIIIMSSSMEVITVVRPVFSPKRWWPSLSQIFWWLFFTVYSRSVFPWDEEAFVDFDPALALRLFIRYTEDLLCYDTVENRPHPLLQHAAASFYELVQYTNTQIDSCMSLR